MKKIAFALAATIFSVLLYAVGSTVIGPDIGGGIGPQIFGETDLIQNSTATTVETFDITAPGCTNASPIVVTTSASHGVANGEWVVIEDVAGNTACNGFFEAASVTSTTLALVGSTGSGTYTSGGVLGEFLVISGTWADGDMSGFTGTSAGLLTYTAIPSVHVFMLHTTSSTPVTDIGNPIVHFGIFHNGALLLDTIAARNMPSTASVGDVVGEGLLQVTTGDTLQLRLGVIEPSGTVSHDISIDHGTLVVLVF